MHNKNIKLKQFTSSPFPQWWASGLGNIYGILDLPCSLTSKSCWLSKDKRAFAEESGGIWTKPHFWGSCWQGTVLEPSGNCWIQESAMPDNSGVNRSSTLSILSYKEPGVLERMRLTWFWNQACYGGDEIWASCDSHNQCELVNSPWSEGGPSFQQLH